MSFSPLFTGSPTPQDKDLATLSNYLDARTTHIDLDWAIDWEKKIIGGSAIVTLEATKDVGEVVLDTSYLDVQGVEVDGAKAVSGNAPVFTETALRWLTAFLVQEYSLDERIAGMGSALHVTLPKSVKSGQVSAAPRTPATHGR
jgi:leukotriene-A4 hydrolase